MEVESDNEDGQRKRPGAHMEDASVSDIEDDMPGLYDSDEESEVRLSDMPLSDVAMNPSSSHSCKAQERDGDMEVGPWASGPGPGP